MFDRTIRALAPDLLLVELFPSAPAENGSTAPDVVRLMKADGSECRVLRPDSLIALNTNMEMRRPLKRPIDVAFNGLKLERLRSELLVLAPA